MRKAHKFYRFQFIAIDLGENTTAVAIYLPQYPSSIQLYEGTWKRMYYLIKQREEIYSGTRTCFFIEDAHFFMNRVNPAGIFIKEQIAVFRDKYGDANVVSFLGAQWKASGNIQKVMIENKKTGKTRLAFPKKPSLQDWKTLLATRGWQSEIALPSQDQIDATFILNHGLKLDDTL